jgi:hypothetical protein
MVIAVTIHTTKSPGQAEAVTGAETNAGRVT